MYTKIAKVSSELVGKLQADKKYEAGKTSYVYLSADFILQEAGKLMAENGLVIIPSVIATNTQEVQYESYGQQKTRIDASVTFEMVITDGEKEARAQWVGMGTDYTAPDKAVYKAITSGHKYFIMKLFNIGIGNTDSEHDSAEPLESRQPLPAKPQPKKETAVSDEQRKPSEAMLKKLWASGNAFYGAEWEAKRAELVKAVTKGRTDSSKQLTFDECKKLIDGIEENANKPGLFDEA